MKSGSWKMVFFPMLTALLFFALAPAVIAQEVPQPEPVDPETVTEEQIAATARAYLVVAELRHDFESSLQAIETPEQAQELQMQIEIEMLEAIEAEGLTPDLYNGIILAANEDEALLERLMAQIAIAEQDRG